MKRFLFAIMFSLAANAAAAASQIDGLVCDHTVSGQDFKFKVTVDVEGDLATLSFASTRDLLGPIAYIQLSAADVQPILLDNLDALANKSFKDRSSNDIILFTVGGRDYTGKRRLSLQFKGSKNFRLTNCSASILWRARY